MYITKLNLKRNENKDEASIKHFGREWNRFQQDEYQKDLEDLAENFNALMAELLRLKPSSSKGKYIRGVSLSSTMGVGVRVAMSN